MKKKPDQAAAKRAITNARRRLKRKPTPAKLLNDIHEGVPIFMDEALSVISYLEKEIEVLKSNKTQAIFDALYMLKKQINDSAQMRPPPLPKQPINEEEVRRMFEEKWRRAREERERQEPLPPPRFLPIHLPPVVIHPWHPNYPLKPYC